MNKLDRLKNKYKEIYGKSAMGRKANDTDWLKLKIREAKDPFFNKRTQKKKAEPKKAGPKKAEPKKAGPKKAGPKKAALSNELIKDITKHRTESLPSDEILMLRLRAIREDSSAKRKLRKLRKRTKKMRKEERKMAEERGERFIKGKGWVTR